MALSAADRSDGASLPPMQGPASAGLEAADASPGFPSVTLVIESTSGTLDDSTPDCHLQHWHTTQFHTVTRHIIATWTTRPAPRARGRDLPL